MRAHWFVCLALLVLACTPSRDNDDADTAGPSCTDRQTDGAETDVDCGGTCSPCANGKKCTATADCASGDCNAGTCRKSANCSAESDEQLCTRLGKTCGPLEAPDSCGDARSVNCGTCPRTVTCTGATSSGLSASITLGTLTDAQAATLCDFFACQWGGYGKKVTCDSNLSVDGPTGLEDCAGDLKKCPNLAVGDFEACQKKVAQTPCDAFNVLFNSPECAKARTCAAP